jgi:acyl-CoA-binding protein
LRGRDGWDVSLSHSGELLVVGVSRLGRIGADTEASGRRLYGNAAVPGMCTPAERADLDRLPEGARNDRLVRLWTLKARGSAALAEGDAEGAAVQLGGALRLWRGSPLVDVPLGRLLSLEYQALEDERLRAQEQRIEADLEAGRHTEVLSELRRQLAEHPMHESLCALFMVALYRSGQAWRALETFQRLRRTLVDELGIEPSPRLQRLHQAVLVGDDALDRPGFLRAQSAAHSLRPSLTVDRQPPKYVRLRSA